MYYSNYYWGMNPIWWGIWVVMIFWIFVLPYDVPGQRKKKDSPLDILQQRYAMGQMTTEEYKERKKILDTNIISNRNVESEGK